MNRVPECPWESFKLNEIVTLEKCLHELSQQDPRFKLILRKLSEESVLVEPTKKIQHLRRTRDEQQKDHEFKRRALEMKEQISSLDQAIEFHNIKLDECLASEPGLRLEIIQVRKSIQAVDDIYKLLLHEISLPLDQVHHSFVDSATTLELARKYVDSLGKSKLVSQLDTLPARHRKQILRLATKPFAATITAETSDEIRYTFLETATWRLTEQIRCSNHLLRDLSLIVKLLSTELVVEQDHLKALEGHVNYLRRPVCDSPPYEIVKSTAASSLVMTNSTASLSSGTVGTTVGEGYAGAHIDFALDDRVDCSADSNMREDDEGITTALDADVIDSKFGEIFDSIRKLLKTRRRP